MVNLVNFWPRLISEQAIGGKLRFSKNGRFWGISAKKWAEVHFLAEGWPSTGLRFHHFGENLPLFESWFSFLRGRLKWKGENLGSRCFDLRWDSSDPGLKVQDLGLEAYSLTFSGDLRAIWSIFNKPRTWTKSDHQSGVLEVPGSKMAILSDFQNRSFLSSKMSIFERAFRSFLIAQPGWGSAWDLRRMPWGHPPGPSGWAKAHPWTRSKPGTRVVFGLGLA